MRRPVLELASLVLAVTLVLGSSPFTPARACFQPPPTRTRTVLPLDGAVSAIPTNARPRVTYFTGPYAELACGARPGPPLLRVAGGDGGEPADGGAATVPGSWVLATNDDPRNGATWEFRAAAPLLPQTTYELLDNSSPICDCTVIPPCPPGPLAPFARFTTGAGPDVTPPTFSGLFEGFCVRAVCASGALDCCGPYNHLSLRLMPAADARDAFLVGIQYYVRKDGAPWDFSHPVGPGVINSPVDSISTTRWDITLGDGKWFVIARAFDLSGNEDDNLVEAPVTMPLARDPLCQRVLVDGGVARPDLMFPGLPDGTSMYPPDLSSDLSVGGGGCNCSLARRPRPLPGDGVAAGLVALAGVFAVRNRARRRVRRGR